MTRKEEVYRQALANTLTKDGFLPKEQSARYLYIAKAPVSPSDTKSILLSLNFVPHFSADLKLPPCSMTKTKQNLFQKLSKAFPKHVEQQELSKSAIQFVIHPQEAAEHPRCKRLLS